MAGFITPLLFGVIVGLTGSYSIGLVFVGAHCVVAALLFLLVMGRIERVGDRHNAAVATEEKTAQKAGINALRGSGAIYCAMLKRSCLTRPVTPP